MAPVVVCYNSRKKITCRRSGGGLPMNRFLTVILVMCCVCLPASYAGAASGEMFGGSRLLFFQVGDGATDEFHFVARIVEKKDEKGWDYNARSLRIANLEKGEWVSSFIDYSSYYESSHFRMFAWGKLKGMRTGAPRKFSFLVDEKEHQLTFDEIQENRLARLIFASIESEKNLSGFAAFKKWASLSEKEIQAWQPLFDHLANRNLRWRGNTVRELDLYSVFTGISAIRETLQTDANLQAGITPRQRACHVNLRTILGAVEMYNMDHSTMMETLDLDVLVKEKYLGHRPICDDNAVYYGKNLTSNGLIRCSVHGDPENPGPDISAAVPAAAPVKVAEIAGPQAPSHPWRTMIKNPQLVLPDAYRMIPADCAFIHYPSYTAFRRSFDFLADWAGVLGNITGGESADFSLEKSLKDQLLLKTDLMTRLFADLTISDIVLVCEDPFLFEGSAFAVLLKINNETLLKEKLAMTAADFQKENPVISESLQNLAGTGVQIFSSPDYRFRSYRFTAGGFQIICNSPVLTEKIIKTIAGKLPPLTEFLDLHYFYEHIEKNFAVPDRIFAFLSDVFIRKLISPACKIATRRRLECIRNSLLQTHELLVNDGKLSPDVQCPEGGSYELVGGEIRCPVHRTFGRMTPVTERLPETATQEEAVAYEAFVANYNRYFVQFFDPIGFVFTTEPSFRGRLLIMPLVENGIYSELQKNVRREGMNPGPKLRNGIVKIGSNLRVESLPRPPGWWYSSARSALFDLMKEWFTGCIWIHLADHPLLFHWDSDLLTRSILDNLGGGRTNDFAMLSPVVLSFFSPVLFALEMTDQSQFGRIIDWIQMEIEATRGSSGGFTPQIALDRLEENGIEMYVLSLDLFALKKTFYLASRANFLVISSKKDLLFELDQPEPAEAEALQGNFNLVFYPENIRLMKSDLLEQRARSQRKACLENLRNIAFVNTFRQSGKTEDYYRLLYGAEPLCPAGGVYSADSPASCSIHGSTVNGALKSVPDLLKGIRAISIQSFVDQDGFQSEIRVLQQP